MEPILRGVLHYSRTQRPELVKLVQNASQHQTPKAVMFTCMDCRLLPHQITNTAPGDMFVVRNPGNMVPHSSCLSTDGDRGERLLAVSAEAAALHLTCGVLGIRNVIICGHSDCKAVALLHQTCGVDSAEPSPLESWVKRLGAASVDRLSEVLSEPSATRPSRSLSFGHDSPFQFSAEIDPRLSLVDQLSQVHALQQVENVYSHACVRGPLSAGLLRVHALWLELGTGLVHYFSRSRGKFVPISCEHSLTSALTDAGSSLSGKN